MFTIRDYAPHDFEQLLTLDQLCFPEGIAYSRREMKYYLNRKNAIGMVADRLGNPAIVGFLVAERDHAGSAHIITIDVHPDARRSGLGSAFMERLEGRLLEQGCNSVFLEVAVDNLPAITFYKQHGFTLLKTLPRYYNNSIDGLLM